MKVYIRLVIITNMVDMKPDVTSERERMIPVIRLACSKSGGCQVFKNDFGLSVTMGDEEIYYFSEEDGRDANTIKSKLKELL